MSESIALRLTGISPLMMNNPQTVNPFNPYTKAMKALTNKRKRTESEENELIKTKFMAALYWDEKLGPYLPGVSVWRSIMDGARISRAGKDVERGVFNEDDMVSLEYKGPRDPEGLYADKRFVDIRDASPQKARIMVTRPFFREWSLVAKFTFEDDVISRAALIAAAEVAGRLVGIGTFRQRFGRYGVAVV
jgi:hypothetical protein